MALHFVQAEREFLEGSEPSNAASALGLSEDEVIGKTVRAWGWSLVHAAPEGRVVGAGAVRAVERAVGWAGAPGDFVRALPGVFEVLPGELRFRGWVERYGKALDERAADAARKRNNRTSTRTSDEESDGCPPGRPTGHPPAGPVDSLSRVRPETKEVRSKIINQPPPTPSAESAVVVVGEKFDVSGDVYVASEDDCWRLLQRVRAANRLKCEGMRPRDFGSWFLAAVLECGLAGIFATYRDFVVDPSMRSRATAVFLACWDARKPPPIFHPQPQGATP